MGAAHAKANDLSRSPVALNEDSTLIAVIEMGLASWLIAGRIPDINRNPLRKQDPDPEALLARLHRWRDEAVQAGHPIGVPRRYLAFAVPQNGRSFAADAHGCIMVVGLDGPTEYKVVARSIRARGMAPLGLSVSEFDPAIRRVD